MAFSIAFKLSLVSSISCTNLCTSDAIDKGSSLDLLASLLEFILDEEEVLITLLFPEFWMLLRGVDEFPKFSMWYS
ncbi:hypothetical protein SLEP1_g22358 [Rubroshorea leprosula]|uniref:Uncharacterized protein n=1 Tax=Rubroshorea leprosula TaxID=152421 RepID=A0AAV5JI75_9ROSI|nr:hypothetical protein SLEP1_g22358 [Rubroshorea leprosula]